jgi:ribosomal protein S18 acetylase RimI-like enzyme
VQVAVRNASPEDAAAIADIQIRTWQVAYAHVFPGSSLAALSNTHERRSRFWRERIEEPRKRDHILVAGFGAEPSGFASLGGSRVDESLGEVYAIYVLPEAWGGGVGRALMATALEHLGADGFPEAMLWVLEDNPRARAFYERSGWSLDDAARDEVFLDTTVRELCYRIALDPRSD